MAKRAKSHAIWKGNISFGLVTIPVELHGAEQSNELGLSMLDARDHAPVGFVRTNKKTGEEVPWDQIARGYAVEKDRFVILDDEDLKRANVKSTQTIEIVDFVEASEISPLYFEKPYYLASTAKAGKSYALLRETLRRTKKVGVALVVLHTRQHLALLMPLDRVLVLDLLRFPHELRSAADIVAPASDLRSLGVQPKEIAMAERLVADMTSKWKPERYHDQYRDDLLALIRRKARGKGLEEIAPIESEPPQEGAKVVDLMALLERSIGGRKRGSKSTARPARPGAKRVAPPRTRRSRGSA